MTHLITGATGALGQAIIAELRSRGALKSPTTSYALGARDPSRLEAEEFAHRRVDYDDETSLRVAFEGVATLLLVSSNASNEVRQRQHATAIRVAREVNVRRIIYTSFVGADRPESNPLLRVHHDAERRLRESGVPWVALRNGLYLDALPGFLGPFRDTGAVAHPAGDAGVAWISRRDIAAFTVDVLLDATTQNLALNVIPPATHALPTVIRAVSEKAGMAIDYQQPADGAYRSMLTKEGLDDATAKIFSQVCSAMRAGVLDVADDSFEQRLARRPESVAAFIDRTF